MIRAGIRSEGRTPRRGRDLWLRRGRAKVRAALAGAALTCASAWAAPLRAGAAPPTGPSADDDDVVVASPSAELVAPKLVASPPVEYPAALLERATPPQGVVRVRHVVDVNGIPRELEVIEAADPALVPHALEAVADLRFEAATYRGQPVEVVLTTPVAFSPPTPEPTAPAAIAPDETSPPESEPAGPGVVRGVVRVAGERRPLPRASVYVLPAPAGQSPGPLRGYVDDDTPPVWTVGTTTDAEGRFAIEGLPTGRVRVVVVEQDHERFDVVEVIADADPDGLEVRYFVRPLDQNPYRTEVRTDRDDAVTARAITTAEIQNLPGTQGDALKAITNFPGVARPPIGAGLLVIRGSAPSDSRTLLGHHEIPQLFHFGAIRSVFNSDAITQIDFIPGNFDARFGNAIGGVVNVTPRAGRTDAWHGYVQADIFDATAFAEGPTGDKGSVLLSVRRSYADALLSVALPDDANLDFQTAPRYWDYQALFDYPVGSSAEVGIRVFGSDDRLALVTEAENDPDTGANDRFEARISFHRVDFFATARRGPWTFLFTPSYRHDEFAGAGSTQFDFETTQDEFSGRAELTRRLSRRASVMVGAAVVTGAYTIRARAPAFPAPGVGFDPAQQAADIGGPFASTSVFATATLAPTPRLTLWPGVRLTQRYLVYPRPDTEPRLRLAYAVADHTTLKAGVGMFAQVPDVFEFNPVWGNEDIRIERAVHTSLGAAHSFPALDVDVEVTGFHKALWDLAVFSERLLLQGDDLRPERFANRGSGQVAGVEVLVRRNFGRKFFGWLSYTYSRALYRDAPDDAYFPFDFDQPHILTFLAVYKLPRRWQIGARFRLVSGNPYTGVTDCVQDLSTGGCIPLEGPRNAERLAAFHQLDLRVDKSWVLRRASVNLYLDVQNVYNRRSPEAVAYAHDYQTRQFIAGLPILPSLGVRLSF